MSSETVHAVPPEPRVVVEQMVEAFRRADAAAMVSLFADDVVWEVMGADYMGSGPRYEGRTAVVDDFLFGLAVGLFDLTKPFEVDVKHMTLEGSTGVVEWEISGTSAKGRPYRNVYCVVFVVEDGLVSEVREYCSTERAKRILFD